MERRQLLQSLAFGSFSATPALAAEAVRITVTDLEILTVCYPVAHKRRVRGIDEAAHGKDELVVKLLRGFFDRLKGRDIFEIEWLRDVVQSEIAAITRILTARPRSARRLDSQPWPRKLSLR
jgi:hypothetical protein